MFSTGPYKYNRFDLLEKKAKPDFLDMDKDGDKKESMKKAIKEKSGNCPDGKCGKCDKYKEKKEEFTASVKALIDEGTDFSGYTWDELYEGYISEGLPPALLKAIMKKKAGKGKEVKEGFKPLPTAKMGRQADKAYGKEQQAVRAGDEAGANKQMQRRIAMKDPKGRKAVLSKEEVGQYLMDKGYANNPVSAEVIIEHMSQEWLDQIIENN